MDLRVFFIPLLLSCVLVDQSLAEGLGVVQLDDVIFDKILSHFPVAVVKFDIAFPYGEKHEHYLRFAKEQNVLVEDLVVADVHVKDYGDKDNWALLKRFKIHDKELPAILLFPSTKDTSKWIRYPRDSPVTQDTLKNFVRQNTKLYIGLSGCIEEFDEIAAQFMEHFNRNEDLDKLIEKTSQLLVSAQGTDSKLHMGSVYLQIMKKIKDRGIAFKDEERARVNKLLSTKLSAHKKRELEDRLNVLLSFTDVTSNTSPAAAEEDSKLEL